MVNFISTLFGVLLATFFIALIVIIVVAVIFGIVAMWRDIFW